MEALLTDTPVSGQAYLRPPSQKPVFLNSHTNSVSLHSDKRPAPVTDIFFASRESHCGSKIHIACLPGVRKGRGKEFGHDTALERTSARTPLFSQSRLLISRACCSRARLEKCRRFFFLFFFLFSCFLRKQ